MVKTAELPLTEEKILKAATRVFRAKGCEGARMQEIADEAGINKAMLHYYFRSKELLFERVFRDTTYQFFSQLNSVLRSDHSLNEKIRLLCRLYIDMSMENPFMPLFMISELNRHPSAFIRSMFRNAGVKPDYTLFRKQIDAEVKAGRIYPVHPMIVIQNILGMCIFPVITFPMMVHMSGMDEMDCRTIMEERRKLVPEMIIRSLQKK
jgi:AcrR family transcriptional regulator